MLGDTSEFGPIDLLGSLAVNLVTTNMACKSKDAALRYGFATANAPNAQGVVTKSVKSYTDARLLLGLGAAVAAQWGGPQVRRYGHDLASGLLNSFVATETIQKHAEDLHMSKVAATAVALVPQIPASVAPPAAGTPNYAYAGEDDGYGGW